MMGSSIDMEVRRSLVRAGVNVSDPLKSYSTYVYNPKESMMVKLSWGMKLS